MLHPIKDNPDSKQSFMPSKWEHKRVSVFVSNAVLSIIFLFCTNTATSQTFSGISFQEPDKKAYYAWKHRKLLWVSLMWPDPILLKNITERQILLFNTHSKRWFRRTDHSRKIVKHFVFSFMLQLFMEGGHSAKMLVFKGLSI